MPRRMQRVTASHSQRPQNPRRRPADAGQATIQGRACGLRRSEEHTSELQSRPHLVCRLLLEKKKKKRKQQKNSIWNNNRSIKKRRASASMTVCHRRRRFTRGRGSRVATLIV